MLGRPDNNLYMMQCRISCGVCKQLKKDVLLHAVPPCCVLQRGPPLLPFNKAMQTLTCRSVALRSRLPMLNPSRSAFMLSLRKCCAAGSQLWLLQICSTGSQLTL